MMPTYNYFGTPSELKREFVFDPKTSVSNTGYVTELLRLHSGSIRSSHPTMPVAAVGKYSYFLTRDHDEHALSLLPYFRLAKIDGKYLSIGLGDRLLAIRHTGQVMSGLYFLIPYYCATQYRKPNNEVAVFHDYYPCPGGLKSITPILEEKGIIKSGIIGIAEAKTGQAKDIIAETSRLLINNPELTLCDKPGCIWCRAVEKKLGLYPSIPEPRFYQYQFLREIVFLLNKVRITRFNYLMYRDQWNYPFFLASFYLYARALAHRLSDSKNNGAT
jgi:aminoglycoside N3'-acetyltransferase